MPLSLAPRTLLLLFSIPSHIYFTWSSANSSCPPPFHSAHSPHRLGRRPSLPPPLPPLLPSPLPSPTRPPPPVSSSLSPYSPCLVCLHIIISRTSAAPPRPALPPPPAPSPPRPPSIRIFLLSLSTSFVPSTTTLPPFPLSCTPALHLFCPSSHSVPILQFSLLYGVPPTHLTVFHLSFLRSSVRSFLRSLPSFVSFFLCTKATARTARLSKTGPARSQPRLTSPSVIFFRAGTVCSPVWVFLRLLCRGQMWPILA